MQKSRKIIVFLAIMLLGFIGRTSQAHAYNLASSTSKYAISTNDVDSVSNTDTFTVGDTVYTNAAVTSGGKIKSYVAKIYKDGSLYDSASKTFGGYARWFSWGHTITQPGSYSFQFTETDTNGERLSVTSNFTVYDVTPKIRNNPSANTVVSGKSATFSVSMAQGTNLSYQWWYNTENDTSRGHKIPGATSSSYTVSNTTASMNGRYYFCVITNYGGWVTSQAAKLTVHYELIVNVNEYTVYAYDGNSAAFSVSASGGYPSAYSYQWYYSTSYSGRKILINGATSPTYSITASSDMDGWYYWCKVRNGTAGIYAETYSPGMALRLKYLIKYNANGGSGAPGSQTKHHGNNLTLSSTKPTRDGYTFLGWSTSRNTATAQYSPNGTYTANAGTTLYAVWKSNPTYKITYDANGGSGMPDSQIKHHGKDLTLSSVKPTRNGAAFLGWSTSKGSNTVQYYPGGKYTADADVTLYAVWKSNEYKIKYDANGGSGAPESQTKYHGKDLTLSSTKPYKDGAEFLGWAASKNSDAVQYYLGGKYTADADVTLYAIWKSNEYEVKYDANGGSGAPESQTKYHGKDLMLSIVKPSRNGYEFLGWSVFRRSATAEYLPGDRYSANAGIILYAVWKKEQKQENYQVMYDANGGENAPESQTKYHGVDLILCDTEPHWDGHIFLGWSTSQSATAPEYLSGGEYTADGGATLYAVWKEEKPKETYQIVYNANGGSGAPESQIKYYGVDLMLSWAEPYWDGHIFLGWSTSKTAGTAEYYPGGRYTADAAAKLYAVWGQEKPSETYQIVYNANGGDGAPESQTKYDGIDLTLSWTEPYWDGHEFLGWSTSKTAGTAEYYPGGRYTANAEAKLYAVWKDIPDDQTYQILYDANGGNDAPASQTKYEGVALTLSEEEPYWDGHEFLGWSLSKIAETAEYFPGGQYIDNAAARLYAVWKDDPEETYQIVYDANGGSGAPKSQTKYEGEPIKLRSTKPTRDGYKFLGWSAFKTAETASYFPNDTYWEDGDITLYAVWKKSSLSKKKTAKISAKSVIEKEYGNRSFMLNATTNSDGKMTYKTSNKKVLTVSANGKVTIKGYGDAKVTVTVSETKNYTKASKSITVKIFPKSIKAYTVSSLTKGKIVCKWKPIKGVKQCEIQIAKDKRFSVYTFFKSKMNKKRYRIDGAKSKRVYYVRMRSCVSGKGFKVYGKWSPVKKIKIK